MTKLYYHPNSSALASFIAAVAADIRIDVEQVAVYTDHKTDSGVDFYTINPKGNVPCLVLDDGTVLNEGSAVLQYIADQVRTVMFDYSIGLPLITFCIVSLCSDVGPWTACWTSWNY